MILSAQFGQRTPGVLLVTLAVAPFAEAGELASGSLEICLQSGLLGGLRTHQKLALQATHRVLVGVAQLNGRKKKKKRADDARVLHLCAS